MRNWFDDMLNGGCTDGRDRLNVWDLNTPRKPKLQSVVNFKHPVK